MDKEESSAAVREQSRRCAELVGLFQAARDQLPPLPRSLIVVEEQFSRTRICKWLTRPLGSEQAALRWLQRCKREEGGAVAAAIKLLKGKPRSAAK